MRKLLIAPLVLFAGAAISPTAAAQDTDWTGPYIGIGGGYSFKSDDEVVVFDTDGDGQYDDTVRTSAGANTFAPGFCDGAAMGASVLDGCRSSDGAVKLSVRAGYDFQFGNWVVGAVADYGAVNLGDDVSAFSTTPAASYTFTRDLNSLTSLRARGGWASKAGLMYATAGMAWGDMDQSFTTTNTVNTFTPSEDSEIDGYQVGIGYEVKLGDIWLVGSGWSMGLEYIWTSLDDGDYPVAVGPGTAPATNPFLITDPTGTDMKRTKDLFEYNTVGITLNWRP
jgi:outer membrane immunogenic protein